MRIKKMSMSVIRSIPKQQDGRRNYAYSDGDETRRHKGLLPVARMVSRSS